MDPTVALQIASLQAEIAALTSAIISGVTRVSYDGKSTEFDDFNGMKQRLSFARDILATLQNPNYRKPQAGYTRFFGYSKRNRYGGYGTQAFWF